jgi:hypothetical protein
MGKYTAEISELRESGFDFGLRDYPIFDESYREFLNQKILDHYMYYEIGQDSPQKFKFYLNLQMREIMPLYNQRYESTKLAILPLINQSVTEETHRNMGANLLETTDGTNDATDTLTIDMTKGGSNDTTITDNLDVTNREDNTRNDATTRKHIESDTPQKMLEIGNITGNVYADKAEIDSDGLDVIEGKDYTSAQDRTGTNNQTTTETNNQTNETTLHGTTGATKTNANTSTDDFTHTLNGLSGSQSALLLEFRKTFINIDMEVIGALADIFFGLL